MPLVTIPTEARDLAVKAHLEREKQIGDWHDNYNRGYEDGVMAALRALLPSEVVGLIIMDADCALEGERLFTEMQPRLVLAEDAGAEEGDA